MPKTLKFDETPAIVEMDATDTLEVGGNLNVAGNTTLGDGDDSVAVFAGMTVITPTDEDVVMLLQGAGDFTAAAGGKVNLQGHDDSKIEVVGGELQLKTTSNGDILLAPAGDLRISNAANIDAYAIGELKLEAGPYGSIKIGCSDLFQTGCPIDIGTADIPRNITIGSATVDELELNAKALDINVGVNGFEVESGGASSMATTAGNLSVAAAAELMLDDVGSGLSLSQSGDRALSHTGSGELFENVTSIVAALNRIADALSA